MLQHTIYSAEIEDDTWTLICPREIKANLENRWQKKDWRNHIKLLAFEFKSGIKIDSG